MSGMVSEGFKFTAKDDKELEKYGFDAYMIDFSGVPDKEIVIFLEFIKRRNKIRKNKRLG